jgi:putative hydrolase of the HAD superfamily
VPDRLVLLDFDGTLAYRDGLWSGCALEVLDSHHPGHGIEIERFRSHMQGAYPWNRPEQPHLELGEPDAWWQAMEARLADAFERCGIEQGAPALARGVRERFVDHTVGWSLFDDTIPALQALRRAGWRTVVLSNHVPELPDLVGGLGLDGLLEAVFSSAAIGYEKPNPEAFNHALRVCGSPGTVWMVGDNPVADIEGAEAAGIPAVLVRSDGPAARQADGLAGAVEIILGAGGDTNVCSPS